MRLSLTLLVSLLALSAFGSPVLKKLNEVNKCWAEQSDVNNIPYETLSAGDETQWIQLHLSLVEQTLRARNTSALTPEQKANRFDALDHLNEYWHAGKFPQNEEFSYRLPIFIDKYDNFCAVGYLVKATGHEAVSRKIQANTNYAYVREMRYPELFAWAKEYGFTIDELAWIQPSYWPMCYLYPLAGGVGGEVNELFVDGSTQRLYVGGGFPTVDGNMTANNIAYVTEANNIYTWHNIGSGVNGSVNAIAKLGNDIFVGGSFTTAGGVSVSNVARWDGLAWTSAGCLNGSINDLVVFGGELYAAGQFSICNSPAQVNFAKWTGAAWQGIPGLTGKINTMEVRDAFLYLGGAFSYNGNATNAIRWDHTLSFQVFNNPLANEVMDFELFKDTMYLVCKHTSLTDSQLYNKLQGNTWVNNSTVAAYYSGTKSFNTLCALGDTFTIGGYFKSPAITGGAVQNSVAAPTTGAPNFGYLNWFMADSTINKMVVFKNTMISGGRFSGSIGRRVSTYLPYYLPPVAKPYTLPACDGASNGTAAVWMMAGKYPCKYSWSTGDTTDIIYNVPAGMYTVVITDALGAKDTADVTVTASPINTNVSQSGPVLTAPAGQGAFQWINCDNNQDIPGANSNTYTATADGKYAVRITVDSCSKVSECYAVIVNAVDNIATTKAQLYPNPVSEELTISLKETAGKVSVILTDITGRRMFAKEYNNTNSIRVNTSHLVRGVYVLKLEENGKTSQYKLVKD